MIHGAVMGPDLQTDAELIERTTRRCLEVADDLGVTSLALPALGTGVGGFPLDECASIMVDVARGFDARSLERVIFAVFGPQAERVFEAAVGRTSKGRLRLTGRIRSGPRRGLRLAPMSIRGLICAGGEATRLEELTRASNKHLLPIGRWPMIYYPLQLLQIAGIREVLIVTGQGHAGQLIDLLGDGNLESRTVQARCSSSTSRTRSRRHRVALPRSSPWRKASRQAGSLSFASETTCSSTRSRPRCGTMPSAAAARRVFVKEVPDPERFGVVVYGADGRVADVVEKAGVLDTRYQSPPTNDAVVGLYCYDSEVFDIVNHLAPSARGELEISDVNSAYAPRGRLEARRVEGWWHDAGTHESLAELAALVEQTGANKPS